jgi:hypothetical protein
VLSAVLAKGWRQGIGDGGGGHAFGMAFEAPVIRKVGVGVSGFAITGVGIALLILPGPGLLLVLAGLVILSSEYRWANRLVAPVRTQAMAAAEASVQSAWRVAGSVAAGAALLAAGVAWIVVPALPFGGVATGVSLIVSGFLLLGLLAYSWRRWRVPPVGELRAGDDADGRDGTGGKTAGREPVRR